MSLIEHTADRSGGIPLPRSRAKAGSKPLVRLARESAVDDPYTLADTARETRLALIACHAQLYRRDTVILMPDPSGRPNMLPMTAMAFRTWIDQHLLYYIEAFDKQTNRLVKKVKNCSTSEAETILISGDFWPSIPQVCRTHPLPMPVIRSTGILEMLPIGYDAETQIYTFSP